MGFLSACYVIDLYYELLADYSGSHYFTTDRLQHKNDMGRADHFQLYANAEGYAVSAFCSQYICISADSGADHADSGNLVGTVIK